MTKLSPSTLVAIFALVTFKVEAYGRIPEGGECIHPNGVTGICSKISDCPGEFKTLTQSSARSSVCSFQGRIAIICCTVGRPGVKSAGACGILEDRLPNIGVHSISNGVSPRDKFPHMALLGYPTPGAEPDPDSDPDWRCGGSLISEQYILTAAHCIVTKYGNVSKVLLGAVNPSNPSGNEKYFDVERTYVHPNYTARAWYNDIALIKLNGNVKLSPFIYPACLYTRSKEPNSLIVSGWGQTRPDSQQISNTLQEGKNEVKLVQAANCTARYFNNKQGHKVSTSVPNGITPMMFCAADDSLSDEFSTDTCQLPVPVMYLCKQSMISHCRIQQGDSGGPIQLRNYTYDGSTPIVMYHVVGVTSGGPLCGGEPPGVYTRVYHYLDWIESIIYQK